MPDALSFSEIDGQHLELLPARTVLSLFSLGGGGGGNVVSTPSCSSAVNADPGLLTIIPQNTDYFTCVGTTTSSH